MQDDGYLSLKEAATRKGAPTGDLRKAIEAGELPAEQRGGEWFVRPEDLERWEPHPMTAAGADFTLEEANDYVRGEVTG
jgi:excisionase family DNA binding protein